MNKFTFTGCALWAGSVVVLIFQAIASIMHSGIWKNHTLATLSGDRLGALIEAVPFESLEKGLLYLSNDLPLYQLLLAAGVIFFLMSSFSKK